MDTELLKLKYELEKIQVEPQKYTMLDVIDKVYDENIISNWLSFIFNADINGIGNEPVQALLKSLKCKIHLENQQFIDIKREEPTNDNKRMDLVIRYTNIWIIIENKICSFEHDDQTKKYFDYIEEKRKEEDVEEIVYVYLRPDWNSQKDAPKKNFEKENEGFRNLYYSELIKSLKEISFWKYKEPEKFMYLKSFIEIGEKYYMNKKFEINEEVQLYIDQKDKIKKIQNKYEDIRNRILKRIGEVLPSEFENYYSNYSNTYIQNANINWNNKDKSRNEIHYEIYSEDFPELLGKENAHIEIHLHIESGVDENKRNKIYEEIKKSLSKENIKKYESKLWIILDKDDYNFKDETEIEKSIEKISNKILEIDRKWKNLIDNWKNL